VQRQTQGLAPARAERDKMKDTERKRMLALLELAHRYLDSTEVRAIPFAMNSGCVAKRIKKVLDKAAEWVKPGRG